MTTTIQETFNDFVHNSLNTNQREAVLKKEGGLLVIAGAGSGKTRVITSRIANLVINEGISPRSIIALTFTNKAAGEMKERLAQTFAGHYALPFVGTFHSYCLLLLRTNPHILDFPDFSIMDGDDQQSLVKKILKKYALTKILSASTIGYQISNYKNKAIALNNFEASWSHPMMQEVYLEYEAEKAQARSFDFDDIIINVLKLFRSKPEFKQMFQKKIRHIMVDEYQDTSHVQHELLRLMGLDDKDKLAVDSVCAVGDEDQSIYSWRGATVTNILKFKNDFAPVVTIKIEQNYRSVQPILEAANKVISHNKMRNPKNLWSDKKATNRILWATCQSGQQEAQIIAGLIKTLTEDKKKLSDVAILYRTHYQSRIIEEALIHGSIPYRIIGGISFYQRKEIKDLLAHLRLILNPYDKISLLRIINTPTRGLGKKVEEQILHSWVINPMLDFMQLIDWMCQDEALALPKGKIETLQEFVSIFKTLDKKAPPSVLIDRILKETRYISYLSKEYDENDAESKIENVQEFVQSIIIFEQKKKNEDQQEESILDQTYTPDLLELFLQEISLMQEKIEKDNPDQDFIQMMTLHAAKGLEFDTAIIPGLDEGILPSSRSLHANEDLEEERRLMYVGMTRAREHLVLLNAHSRITFGQIVDHTSSRFLDELPEKLVQKMDLNRILPSSAHLLFRQWMTGNNIKAPSRQPAQQQSRRSAIFDQNPFASTPGRSAHKPARNFATRPKITAGWKKNQTVIHPKFGAGLVTHVEPAPSNEYYVTALFRVGKKKILSHFLKKV